MFWLALLIAVQGTLFSSRASQPPERPLLERWAAAAEGHTPGVADASVREAGDWSRDQLSWILGNVESASDRTMRRAAVLHLDVALHGRARAMGALFRSYPRTGPMPPSRSSLFADGTGIGSNASSTHLEFARALLLRIGDPASRTAFARRWYVASAAELARRRHFAELTVHLDHARRMLPDDPAVLLASGCLHEYFAGPAAQAARRERPEILVGGRRENLVRAERYFARAHSLDPRLAEAVLRRGRVLGLLNSHLAAREDLRLALDLAEDSAQLYYALLFLGRSEEALGQLNAAREHFERASRLFPLAQSPRLALSRLAAERGDDREALRALDPAFETPGGLVSDPWWVYDLGPGRDAARELARLHDALREEVR